MKISTSWLWLLLGIGLAVLLYVNGTALWRSSVIAREAVRFDPPQVPVELIETLSTRQVILLGETHYVQEHQDFIMELIPALVPHGAGYFLQELSHAFSWIAEDYVLGRRKSLPDNLAFFDGPWLSALRRINQTLPEENRITCRYFDMNHAHDSVLLSLALMTEEADILPYVSDLLQTRPSSQAYQEGITDLYQQLTDHGKDIQTHLSPLWHERLLEIAEIEQRSLPIRNQWDDHARETIIIDLVCRTIETSRNQGKMVLINTGMYHAQKKRLMGTWQEWLGEYLARNPEITGGTEGLYSLAFFGFSGERIRSVFDPDPFPIPAALTRFPGNLTRQMARIADSQGMYLDLHNPVFHLPTYFSFTGRTHFGRPASQFDGYLVYPEISVRPDLLKNPAP